MRRFLILLILLGVIGAVAVELANEMWAKPGPLSRDTVILIPPKTSNPASAKSSLTPSPRGLSTPLLVWVSGSVSLVWVSVPVWLWGFKIIAQRTGVSVRATRPDRMMDVAIVIPNWR